MRIKVRSTLLDKTRKTSFGPWQKTKWFKGLFLSLLYLSSFLPIAMDKLKMSNVESVTLIKKELSKEWQPLVTL